MYAAATFVIKGLMALLAWMICRKSEKSFVPAVVSGVVAELFMAFSYFAFEWILLGQGIVAASGIPANLIQGAVGAVLALLLFKLFAGNKTLSEFLKIF